MPYHRGDYVGGSNYYRGDPFLGALIKGAAKVIGVDKLVKKAGKWAVSRITGSSVKKAAVGTAVTAVGAPILMSAPRATGQMPIQLGPVGIDPMSVLPGGEPFITVGGGPRKYRRMNPLNPKALRRALRRAEGFEKFARRTVNGLRAGPKKFKTATRKR